MDYQKIAGDVLFGASILDNAMRGLFIEALVYDELRRRDREDGYGERWSYVGLGWGPWDLQRGSAKGGDRVRFQVKTKASEQLWTPQKQYEPVYDLGLRKGDSLPSYFERDFPAEKFGVCEPSGYRTDFFLLAWHSSGTQADPDNYQFYIVPVSDLNTAGMPARLSTSKLFAQYEPAMFSDLAKKLNDAADGFLVSSTTQSSVS